MRRSAVRSSRGIDGPSWQISTLIAPEVDVDSTLVPCLAQRSTMSGFGKPQRFAQPADTTAISASTAVTNAVLDEVWLPWCGIVTSQAVRNTP